MNTTSTAAMSVASTKIYSQLLINLGNLNSQLGALSNLPADASGIQNTAEGLINTDINNLKAIQSAVLNYATPTIPALNDALTNLNNNNTGVASVVISNANQGATNLSGTISGLISGIMDTKTQIVSLSNTLTTIDQALKSQIVGLQSQAQDAQNQADYYTKRKYYFLALGPFGLVGLGIAIGFIVSWSNKASDLNAQVSALNAQSSSIQLLTTSVDALISNFSGAVSQISNIKNSVDFLSADIQNVITDLDNSTTANAILYLTAVIHELQTLELDAS